MFRQVVAVSFVVIWLVFLGIEFSEDMGFIDYDGPDMDRSMETTLASLGQAIKISEDSQVTPASTLATLPRFFYSLLGMRVPSVWFRKGANFLKEDTPIYKLHLSFLI